MTHDEHAAILDALRRGDGAAAGALMADHLARSRALRLAAFA